MTAFPGFLTNPEVKLLLFGGKGGVGKTTCAAAAALVLARRAAGQVVVLSTDPAHSLKDSFANAPLPANLEVVELNASEALDQFRRRHGRQLEEIAERGTFLDREDIRRFLSLSLPGMDELFGFLAIARRASAGNERVLVDTAPSGHTLRLLAMPELMRQWVDVLDTLLAKHRFMKERLAGTYRADELDRFLDEQAASVNAAQRLLQDPQRCRFVPVMLAEELSVRETNALVKELDRWGIDAREGVVNRLVPSAECDPCAGALLDQARVLGHLSRELSSREWWGAPLHPREVQGSDLETFWSGVTPLSAWKGWTAAAPTNREIAAVKVEDPAPLPAAGTRLLFFAGKGGVGKTTLACASAVHLAHVAPHRRILLFSTDPAPSLGDCLGLPVGPKEAPVTEGLTALEMDASRELEALKQQYRREVDAFFNSLLGGFDVPFDRETMERVIDLSPPGLDEIMGLTQAMDFLSAKSYDLLILDTAPTGHLVRLLEMPQLLDDWLKAFFELILKYRRVFGVPELAERLVQASRNLHRFRAIMRDPGQAAVDVTSIPTRMALEETTDLLAACRRTGVNVPVMFLNMLTEATGCDLCAQQAAQEHAIEIEFSRAFSGRITRVFRQVDEPRGLQRLARLGGALYQGQAVRGGWSDARASP